MLELCGGVSRCRRVCRAALLLPLPILVCPSVAHGEPGPPHRIFTDVSKAAGIDFRHRKPILDHQLDNIMSWVCSVGAAAAAGDYNNDGWLDLYLTNSAKGRPNRLYRNNGDGTFTDVADEVGLAEVNGERGVSMDCIWGDYDNDGWIDLYLVRWGNDALFRNNGGRGFSDVTSKLFRKRDGTPGTDWANGNAVIFLDYNLDGRPDIYVGNYFDEIDLWNLKTTRMMHDSFENARNAGRNFLYCQESDGTFREVGGKAGVADTGWTLAVGSADVDNDGWPDLYCADDFGPDQLFVNRHDGTFRNVTESALGFDTKKGMSVDFGDFDNDGWLDIYVANITTAEYLQEGNMLWHNNGIASPRGLSFIDVSLETGTYDGGWGWGAKFLDFDNDGDLDLFAVNGFISGGKGDYWYDLASWTVTGSDPAEAKNWPTIGDRSFSGYERTRLWQNDGLYRFTERAAGAGIGDNRDGRGVVCFDYDNDGDVDLFVANQDQPPILYRNAGTPGHHWLTVQLFGDPRTGSTRDGLGTRVTIVTEAGRQIRERDGGNGYCGQSDPRLHFGLGRERVVRLLEVRWPDGGLQYRENVRADQILKVAQDPSHYTATVAIERTGPRVWEPAEAPRAVVPAMDPEKLEALLADLEDRLRAGPVTHNLAARYRGLCSRYDRHDRSIGFLKGLLDADPDAAGLRAELACAYVDKIPTCGGMAAVVCKGTLARKSLDELDRIIADNDDSWVAHYCRGMNHLHWPRALRHSSAAAADLTRCIELQERDGRPNAKEWFVRAYVLLGDAQVKAGNVEAARQAWRAGARVFPESNEIKERLAIRGAAGLLEFVESKRSLDLPIDTDLSFLDRTP